MPITWPTTLCGCFSGQNRKLMYSDWTSSSNKSNSESCICIFQCVEQRPLLHLTMCLSDWRSFSFSVMKPGRWWRNGPDRTGPHGSSAGLRGEILNDRRRPWALLAVLTSDRFKLRIHFYMWAALITLNHTWSQLGTRTRTRTSHQCTQLQLDAPCFMVILTCCSSSFILDILE